MLNSSKSYHKLIGILAFFSPLVSPAQVVIDGINLKVQAGTAVYVHDMGLNNQTNAADGSIDNEGDIYIDGDWNNNATGGSVFINQNATGTVHFTGSAAQALGGARTTAFENLTVNNTSATGVTLGQAITINQSLTLNDGIVYTDATNLLTVSNGGSANEGNTGSFIDGPVKKIGNADFTFPTSDGTVWAPIGIANLTGDANTEFTAEYTYGAYGDLSIKNPDPNGIMAHVSTLEYWDLDHAGTASNADVTLHWKDQNRSQINDYADLVVAHYDGADWENLDQDAVTSSDPGDITVTGVSSFSPFTFGSMSTNNPLPIVLINFDAKLEKDQIVLYWATASELNNDFFSVEKSRDARNFQTIATVQGAGNSNEVLDYQVVDRQPDHGINYYRLKQTDFDGSTEYSEVVAVDYQIGDNIQFTIFPNPARENAYIKIKGDQAGREVSVVLRDIHGNELLSKTTTIDTDGTCVTAIDNVDKLKPGIYMVTVSSMSGLNKQKLIVR